MLRWLTRGIRNWRGRARARERGDIQAMEVRLEHSLATEDLQSNIHRIREALGQSSDLVVREFTLGGNPKTLGALLYIDGLANATLVGDQILRTLMRTEESTAGMAAWHSRDSLDQLKSRVIAAASVREEDDLGQAVLSLVRGETLVLTAGQPRILVCGTRAFEMRSVEEPTSESGVRVPREGFTESLRVNTSLLRRRIQNPNLWIESLRIGRVTQTQVAIAYVEGIVNDELVSEVRRRLQRIEVDGILESGYLEEFIEDNPYSPFPQTLRTERPDVVAANLLEGRVAVLTDNTPFALVLPIVFTQLLSVSEDYYERFMIGTSLRLIRYLAFFASMMLPSLYIAVTTFHQEMLPTGLILSIAAAREGVPFPAIVEAGMMEVIFEILREAGIRLPRVIGPAVSIVGALVLGQAAVSASLVSPAMVVVVATTAVSSFTTPAFSLAISARLLRFLFMIAAAAMGLFGVMAVGLGVMMHLCALRSFGIPYLSPLTPVTMSDWKDVIFRAPWWAMVSRPRWIGQKEPVRQNLDNRPRAPRVRRRPGRPEAEAEER